jgi:diguanylate cyclase (GGDEF)-like protein
MTATSSSDGGARGALTGPVAGELARRDRYQLQERHWMVARARLATALAVPLLALAPGAPLGDPVPVALLCAAAVAAHAVLLAVPARAPRRVRLCVDLSIVVDVTWAAAVTHAAGGLATQAVWLLPLVGLWSALGYSARTGIKSATLASLAVLWLGWMQDGRLLGTVAAERLVVMWALLAVAVLGAAGGERELRRRAERVEILHALAQDLLAARDMAGIRDAARAGAARLMPGWSARWSTAAELGEDPGAGRPRLHRAPGTMEVRVPVPGPDGPPRDWLVLSRARARGAPGRVRVRDLLALEALAAGVGNGAWRMRLATELERRAITDPLTGLMNRGGYDAVLDRALAARGRDPGWLSLCLVDVDRFKRYNDTHGHPAGDAALQAVAGALGGAVRAGDTAARYGGEEMALVLPGAAPGDALEVAERARRAVAALDLHPEGVTVSVGVASTYGACPAEALAEAADRALYRAKREGRDRVVAHPPVGDRSAAP